MKKKSIYSGNVVILLWILRSTVNSRRSQLDAE